MVTCRYCFYPPSCSMVKSMALGAQVPCYIQPTGNHSICDLPCADYVRVFWTAKNSFVSQIDDQATKFSALEALGCISNGTSRCLLIPRPKPVTCRAAFRSTAYLKHYLLTATIIEPFDRQTACPFARSATVTDNELAYGIMNAVSMTFGWYRNSTIDWYSISKSYSFTRAKIYIEVIP